MAVVLAVNVLVWVAVTHLGRTPAHSGTQTAANTAPFAGTRRGVPESAFASQPPFTGSAVAAFGQGALQAAYRQVVNFAFDTGWNTALIPKRKSALTAGDFTGPQDSLTPSAAKSYLALVGKALGNSKTAIRDLEGATLFSVGAVGGARAISGPAAVTNRRFSRPAVAVNTFHGRHRLSFTFIVRAVVHLRDASGKKFTMATARKVRYLLVPNPATNVKGRPFLIDEWSNRLQAGNPQAA